MKKGVCAGLAVVLILAVGPCAFAQDEPDLTAARNHRLLIEAQLSIKAHEDIYDVANHYVGDYMMRQVPEDLDVLIS